MIARAHQLAVAEPPFRSRKVLDHARNQPCCLRLPGICNRNPETTVSAHIRDRHKGMAQKASDHSVVFCCHACHDYLDVGFVSGKISDADLLRAIITGLQETWEILIRDGIIDFPHDRVTSSHQKKTPPRKPKDLRAKFPAGKPLQSRPGWPAGRKLQSGPMGKAKP